LASERLAHDEGQRYNRGVERWDRIAIGLVWMFVGFVWLYRAARQEADPSTPVTLFAEPKVQSDREKTSKMWLGVLNIVVGCLYTVTGIFSHH
jgi:hypothetical protein